VGRLSKMEASSGQNNLLKCQFGSKCQIDDGVGTAPVEPSRWSQVEALCIDPVTQRIFLQSSYGWVVRSVPTGTGQIIDVVAIDRNPEPVVASIKFSPLAPLTIH
jgi:predicted secreted protein